jgi:AraC family ethanolamine operon transcriptional activator
MTGYATVDTRNLDSFEELNYAVRGAHSEVVQLDRGQVRGHLTHMSVGGLPLNLGAFSLGVRARGVLSDDRVTIGMLTGYTNRVTHWSYEMHPGDVLVTPPGVDHDGRYYGGASFAVISLDRADIDSVFGSEPRLREPGTWQKNHFRAEPQAAELVMRRLHRIFACIEAKNAIWNRDAAAFWKRSIVDAMTETILASQPSERDGPLPSAMRIVRKVEDYVDAGGSRPVHISEICSGIRVSRRTLHRAFYDAMGIGPVTFLRYRRLCKIRTILRCSDPTTTTIADVAMQHGFLDLGRFAGYYRSLFDECPSQTLGRRFDRSASRSVHLIAPEDHSRSHQRRRT